MSEDGKKIDGDLSADLSAFQLALETHSGDVSRWPLSVRQRHAALIATNRAAQRLVSEARALDTLIASASPRDDVAAKAIAQRAVAAILQERVSSRSDSRGEDARPAEAAQSTNVVAFPRGGVRKRLEGWAAAAALVACLGLGIAMGQSGWIDPAIDVIAGLEDQTGQTGGLFDDQSELFEEEVI